MVSCGMMLTPGDQLQRAGSARDEARLEQRFAGSAAP